MILVVDAVVDGVRVPVGLKKSPAGRGHVLRRTMSMNAMTLVPPPAVVQRRDSTILRTTTSTTRMQRRSRFRNTRTFPRGKKRSRTWSACGLVSAAAIVSIVTVIAGAADADEAAAIVTDVGTTDRLCSLPHSQS